RGPLRAALRASAAQVLRRRRDLPCLARVLQHARGNRALRRGLWQGAPAARPSGAVQLGVTYRRLPASGYRAPCPGAAAGDARMNPSRAALPARFHLVLFVVGIGTFVVHEFAHWIAGVALGHDMIATPNHVWSREPMGVGDQMLLRSEERRGRQAG